jgi:hypothetical protein
MKWHVTGSSENCPASVRGSTGIVSINAGVAPDVLANVRIPARWIEGARRGTKYIFSNISVRMHAALTNGFLGPALEKYDSNGRKGIL